MVKKPCADCPFKKDTIKGWLGSDRADDIANSSSFTCHKTATTRPGSRRRGLGALLLKQEESAFYRLLNHAARQHLLEEEDKIFPSKEVFINHHKID